MAETRRTKRKVERGRNKVTISKLTLHKLSWLEYITMGIGFWFLLYPKPYEILFTILLLIPIIGLIINGISGRPSVLSLVEISKDENGNDKYDVADFIDFAAWMILIRVLIDYEFESFYSMIIPGTLTFIIVLFILFLSHKQIEQTTKNKKWIYFSLISNVFIYSYAGTYGANCVYDNSEPKVYNAKVLDKRISKGRKGRTTYYVEVTPWGHHFDKEEISVTNSQYESIQIGETVKIDLKEGLFNIPWYYIEEQGQSAVNIVYKNKTVVRVKLDTDESSENGNQIIIVKNNKIVKVINSKPETFYAVDLDLNANYQIKCSKIKYKTKIIEFDTHVPKNRNLLAFRSLDFTVNLKKLKDEVNSNSNNPVGKFAYDNDLKDFEKVSN